MSDEIIQNENVEVPTQEEQVEITTAPVVEETATEVATETIDITIDDVVNEITQDKTGSFYVYTTDMNIHSYCTSENEAIDIARKINGSYKQI